MQTVRVSMSHESQMFRATDSVFRQWAYYYSLPVIGTVM